MTNILNQNNPRVSLFPWKKIFGFSMLPLISSISPLLVLPVLSRALGLEGWTSIAIGMSIGMVGAVIVNYGWGVVGPSAIAQAGPLERKAIYKNSLKMRLSLWCLSAPLLFLIAELLDKDGGEYGAGSMALAMSAGGLTPVWYFIGVSRAVNIALSDTLPRIVAAVVAAVLLVVIPAAALYPLLLLALTLGSSLIWGIRLSRGAEFESTSQQKQRLSASFRIQSPLVFSSIISSAYTSLSVALVSLVNPLAVATFSAGDRIRAMVKQGSMAVGNGLQGWVSEPDESSEKNNKKMRTALKFMSAVAAIIFAIVSLMLPWTVRLIFGDEFVVGRWTSIYFALSLFFSTITISTSFHILAPMGRSDVIARATTIGSLIGVPAILGATYWWGISGAAMAVAAAEAVVFCIEIVVVRKILRIQEKHS